MAGNSNSGGARVRSGPPADPNALRRNRASDKEWATLPSDGYRGPIPDFPLKGTNDSESDLWLVLWRKPQAFMWARLGLELQVAAYVRAFLESVESGASAGLKTAVLRMEAELGLSTVGMGQLRWRIATDEVAERREGASAPLERKSVRDRLKALNG